MRRRATNRAVAPGHHLANLLPKHEIETPFRPGRLRGRYPRVDNPYQAHDPHRPRRSDGRRNSLSDSMLQRPICRRPVFADRPADCMVVPWRRIEAGPCWGMGEDGSFPLGGERKHGQSTHLVVLPAEAANRVPGVLLLRGSVLAAAAAASLRNGEGGAGPPGTARTDPHFFAQRPTDSPARRLRTRRFSDARDFAAMM
jgi:hypothetical protein